ncbi:MAG TPA: enoyl-CoA hydratase/isomerase family protein [Trebonia sp.]|jgi:enoyl-CoA hydratase|nr:enoyl-CoA hydratase/isomerase family protein [Trebonia sp.]
MPGAPAARCRRHGRIGWITLNRPGSINALNLRVIRAVTAALLAWAEDPSVAVVLLDGAGERGFCAGGDIRVVRESALGDPEIAARLWREEYELIALIADYPRPVAVMMDGITMGGGVGLGAHASVRLVSERTVMAMPEVQIGLAPDVGAALRFARAPGETGTHCALTGSRIGPRDAVYCGLADQVIMSERLPSVIDALADPRVPAEPAALLARIRQVAAAEGSRPGDLAGSRPWIDACYRADTVAEILAALRARPETPAAAAASAIEAASPLALTVTLRALRAARTMTHVRECLAQDYRLCLRFLRTHDLAEGIRAAVIDKDRTPRWAPAALAEISTAMVDSHFAADRGPSPTPAWQTSRV